MRNQDSLDRFLEAQKTDYAAALTEIKAGAKRSHWIWYIFPQIRGLGHSSVSAYYGIRDLDEAKRYLENETLRRHLLEISEALLSLDSSDARAVMGSPDDEKLRSSMTLFALADPEILIFQKVLDKFFGGEMDQRTVEMVRAD
jgi:uncharacterized protein (DUF1810 family)